MVWFVLKDHSLTFRAVVIKMWSWGLSFNITCELVWTVDARAVLQPHESALGWGPTTC